MAEKFGIKNVTFRRADILGLHDWEEQFDMVDSIGVLHHMKDPEAGLRALLTRLLPGGLLRLGLYSKMGRQEIVRFRERGQHNRGDLDDNAIRKIRRSILTSSDKNKYKPILQSPDFYSLSGCRDLILHEQEIQVDVPEIQGLLKRNRLTFLGLGYPDPNFKTTIEKLCGPRSSPFDLMTWHEAELRSPHLFAAMYTFFSQYEGRCPDSE